MERLYFYHFVKGQLLSRALQSATLELAVANEGNSGQDCLKTQSGLANPQQVGMPGAEPDSTPASCSNGREVNDVHLMETEECEHDPCHLRTVMADTKTKPKKKKGQRRSGKAISWWKLGAFVIFGGEADLSSYPEGCCASPEECLGGGWEAKATCRIASSDEGAGAVRK
mmetsp:Transcript_38988/g.78116  ORF Transcript_38988/g.78116 Transcript_38988/m.78116 type:complete len:170 (+) Transcript_38988:46-555(+)